MFGVQGTTKSIESIELPRAIQTLRASAVHFFPGDIYHNMSGGIRLKKRVSKLPPASSADSHSSEFQSSESQVASEPVLIELASTSSFACAWMSCRAWLRPSSVCSNLPNASVNLRISSSLQDKKERESAVSHHTFGLVGALTMSRSAESGWGTYTALVLGAGCIRYVCSLHAPPLLPFSTHN